MRTPDELRREQELACAREHRASMRSHAMSYRRAIHPQEHDGDFSERVRVALFYLDLALSYREGAKAYAQMAAAWNSESL